jgi:hypothetical protein
MHMTAIKNKLLKKATSFKEPKPIFDLRLGWSRKYDGIFNEQFEECSGGLEIFKKLSRNGRVLILGPGGGAKTVLLKRLAKHSGRRGYIPVQVSLKKWTAKDYDDWKYLANYSQCVDFLLLRFANVEMSSTDLDSFKVSSIKIILVDGLNEVNALVAGQILNALDEFVRFSIRTLVVVSDRLARRELKRPERWTFGLILPLTEREVLRHIPRHGKTRSFWNAASSATRALLRTPYFLDSFLGHGAVQATKAAELRDFFERHAANPSDLKRIARAAFKVYEAGTRTFPINKFQSIAGKSATQALISARVVICSNATAYFDHHLKHDFLAAMHVASNRKLWTPTTLNRITFRGSSFDTVVFVMEQLTSTQTDRFIRSLYDWNIYGAGYALSEGRHENVSLEMSTVIHGMFAERRWDLIAASAKAASDVLHQIMTPLSKRLLDAGTLNQVLRIIKIQKSQVEWFLSWQALFTAPLDSSATEGDLRLLTQVDSVMGWTSANVLRRKHLSERQQKFVRVLVRSGREAVIRWRAAHVLGRFASVVNIDSLGRALADGSSEVQYGATRSLIELAARSGGDLARNVFTKLAKAATKLANQTNVVNEFQRALIIDRKRAPQGWTKLALPAVAAFQQATAERTSREEWDRTMERLVSTYGY